MKKNKRRRAILLKLKSIWSCLTILLLISILPIIFVPTCKRRYQLSHNSKSIVKAIVVDERDYLPNSPVLHEFYYEYLFTVNRAVFKGSTKSHDYKPGDSIMVEYVIQNPQYNRPTQ